MKNKWIALLLCLSLLLSMTACQSRENPAPTPDQPTASDQQTQDEQPQPDEGEEEVEQPQEEEKTATLYIGMDGEFESYPVDYTGKLTPDWLIEQISELTDWNLDLAEPTTGGKGGITVTFADTCSIVVGPPQEQKEEFFAYDSTSLLQMILDSIQHTLQYNFVDPQQGDPSTLDIYFSMEGKDITLPDGIIVPSTSPYQGIMISDNKEG